MTRIATSCLIVLIAGSVSAASENKPAKTQPVAPKVGIKTPGVQIPIASLKPEAVLDAPAKPDWVFFSTVVFAPAKDVIERIEPKTNKKIDPITQQARPCGGMAAAFNSLWAPVCGTGSLSRIDAKTFKVTATIPTGVAASRRVIAASADSIWLLTDDKSTLSRIDPDQNAVIGELRVPSGCQALTFGETALWLACPTVNKVLRVNPATNLIEKSIEVSAQPEALAMGEGSVWVLCGKEGKVDRIDPKTNKVTKTIELNVPNAKGEIAFGEGFIWITQTGFPLARIDAASESVLQQFNGAGGGALAISPGAIWLSNTESGTIWRIDPKRVVTTLPE